MWVGGEVSLRGRKHFSDLHEILGLIPWHPQPPALTSEGVLCSVTIEMGAMFGGVLCFGTVEMTAMFGGVSF